MKFFSTLICLILISYSSSAQIIDRTKDRAKDKTNNRIDRKIDKGIDKSLDGIEGLFKKKDKDKDKGSDSNEEQQKEMTQEEMDAQNAAAMSMLGFGSSADVKEKYSFNHELEYKITMTEKKGKETENMNMVMMISENEPIFGTKLDMPQGSSNSVFDYDKGQMITLTKTEGMNMGMVMNIDQEAMQNYTSNEEEKETTDSKFRKTGNTKKILGYNCEEWKMEDKDNTSTVWVSTDLDMNIGNALSSMAQGAKKNSPVPAGEYPMGTLMESTSVDNKSGDTYHMIATRVDMNSNPSVSTEGYQFMNMGGK